MRALALIVIAALAALTAIAQEVSDPGAIWRSSAPEHVSTARWACSGYGGDTIEFRFYPSLAEQTQYSWIIRHGQTFMYAVRAQRGLEGHFWLQNSSHEIRIGADRVARYYAFSGEAGERISPSATWYGCKETR